jgi:hypothetical protein
MSNEDGGYSFESEEDEDRLMVDGWFAAECADLESRRTSMGDKSLSEKAERVLRLGARDVLSGRPSTAFMEYVARALLRRLDKEESSFEQAFRLREAGRPPTTAEEEYKVVEAFLRAMYRLRNAPPEERVERSLDWAIKAKHGASTKQRRWAHRKSAWRSISYLEEWRRGTKDLLARWGHDHWSNKPVMSTGKR